MLFFKVKKYIKSFIILFLYVTIQKNFFLIILVTLTINFTKYKNWLTSIYNQWLIQIELFFMYNLSNKSVFYFVFRVVYFVG